MRIAPDCQRYAYIDRSSGGTAVTVVDVASGQHHRLGDGQDVRWEGWASVWWRPQDESGLRFATQPRWSPFLTSLRSGNSLAVGSNGRVCRHRTDPLRIIDSDTADKPRVAWPLLSDDGSILASLAPDQPADRMQSVVLQIGTTAARWMYQGAVTEGTNGSDFRMAGTSLCFREADGRVYGCVDVRNPSARIEQLARAGEGVSHAVPVYAPGIGMFVLHVRASGQQGKVCLASWASMVSGTPTGLVLDVSGGGGFEHDARATPDGEGVLLCGWLRADGSGTALHVDTDTLTDRLDGGDDAAPEPYGTPVTASKALGYFFGRSSKYGTFTPQENCAVLPLDAWQDSDGTLPDEVGETLCGVLRTVGRGYVSNTAMAYAAPEWDKVLGVLAGEQKGNVWAHEPTSRAEAQAWVSAARAEMDRLGLGRRPVVVILPADVSMLGKFVGVADLLAPELYFDQPEATYERMHTLALRRVGDVLTALKPSPCCVIVQAFDRNGDADWVDRPWALEAIQQAANDVIAANRIVGLWWFAYARPGGVRQYPQLETWHQRQIAVTPVPPLPIDPDEPLEPPMDIRLVGPPQDQTKLSLATLREFCQTYEFPAGTKPYVNDTIQSKFTLVDGTPMEGLYCSDGLYYFMLETWAPIMMDPDDVSGWESKRGRADAALQDYMRRRVGDTTVVARDLAGPISRSGREFTEP